MLNPETFKNPDAPVVHLDREVDGELALTVSENITNVSVQIKRVCG
jgi:hypothetical protein